MIQKEILLQIAKVKGLSNREHIEKDYFQDLLLFNIYKKTNLLIFKGGTALYKFYNIPRFSEDLDFSMLENFDVKATIKEAVDSLHECKITEIKELKTSLLLKAQFKGVLTSSNTVRIDININNPVLNKFDVKNYISPYIDISPFSARVMSVQEIIAEKIHSLFAREKARDLYDLFFLLRIASIDSSLVKRKLGNFKLKFNYASLKKRVNRLEPLWLSELGPFVLSELPDFIIVKDFVLDKLKDVK